MQHTRNRDSAKPQGGHYQRILRDIDTRARCDERHQGCKTTEVDEDRAQCIRGAVPEVGLLHPN